MVSVYNMLRLTGLAVVLVCLASFASIDSVVAAESVCQPYTVTGATVCGSTTTLSNDAAYPGTVSRGTISGTSQNGCTNCPVVDCAYLNTRAFNDDAPDDEGWALNASLRYPASGCVSYNSSFSYTSPKVPAGSYANGAYQCDAPDVNCYVVTRHHFDGPASGLREFYTSNDGVRSCPAAWTTPGGAVCALLVGTQMIASTPPMSTEDVAGDPPLPPNDATWRGPTLPKVVDHVPTEHRQMTAAWAFLTGEIVTAKATQYDLGNFELYTIDLRTRGVPVSTTQPVKTYSNFATWVKPGLWAYDSSLTKGPKTRLLTTTKREVWLNTNFYACCDNPFAVAGYEAWQYTRNVVVPLSAQHGAFTMHNSNLKYEDFEGLWILWCRFISPGGSPTAPRRQYCDSNSPKWPFE